MKTVRLIEKRIVPWILPILILVFWHIASTTGLIQANKFPAPLKVLETTINLTKSGELLEYIWISTKRAFTGFFIGAFLGIFFGLINGVSKKSELLTDTTFQMIRTIPNLALVPLVILWFGIAEPAKLILIVLGVFFPVYLNTFHGIRSIDPTLIEMGKVYNLSKIEQFRHIILLGALPSVLVGIRYALGIMWMTLIVAETVAADSGIGYLSMQGREFMQMDIIVLSIFIYALLGKLSDLLAKLLETKWLQWHPNFMK